DADPQPRQGDIRLGDRRLGFVEFGVGHRDSCNCSARSTDSLGSCHFESTGLISSLHTSPTTKSAIMIENDSVYRSGPDLPTASWLSATALTMIGPRMPATDQAVSSRP